MAIVSVDLEREASRYVNVHDEESTWLVDVSYIKKKVLAGGVALAVRGRWSAGGVLYCIKRPRLANEHLRGPFFLTS